jgi:DNA-binding XRE family transcriptional regulator
LKPLPYKDQATALDEHLCERRMFRGALQRDVAAELGVNTWTYLRWENDRTRPLVRHVPRIIAFLGHDPLLELGSGRMAKRIGTRIREPRPSQKVADVRGR